MFQTADWAQIFSHKVPKPKNASSNHDGCAEQTSHLTTSSTPTADELIMCLYAPSVKNKTQTVKTTILKDNMWQSIVKIRWTSNTC